MGSAVAAQKRGAGCDDICFWGHMFAAFRGYGIQGKVETKHEVHIVTPNKQILPVLLYTVRHPAL